MPRQEVISFVDGLVAQGRISRDLRDSYISDIENGLGEHLLRGADYTNKTKELAEQRRQAQAEIEQQRQAVLRKEQELNEWQRAARREIDEANRIQRELPELTARLGAYEQVLTDYQMMDRVNLPPRQTTPSTSSPTSTVPTSPTPSMTNQNNNEKFLTVDAASQALQNMFSMQGKIDSIRARHYKLFGEFLTDDLMTQYMSTGEDPEAHWRVKYAVDLREQEARQREHEAMIARIREEERQKVMQEYSTDPSRIGGAGLQPNQGVAPVLAQYAASRAMAHSENTLTPPNGERVVPEMKPEIQASRDRVAAASQFFAKHFDAAGNPLNDAGRQLQTKYYNPEG